MLVGEFYKTLFNTSLYMARTRELGPLLKYALQAAIELVGAEAGYVILRNADGSIEVKQSLDLSGRTVIDPMVQLSQTILKYVLASAEPLVILDALEEHADAKSVVGLGLRSVMCVPLVVHERVLGAIYVENRSESAIFTQTDLEPLTFFATQAAVFVENAMLYTSLEQKVRERTAQLEQALAREQQLARTDPLTGLNNRGYFFNLAEREFTAAVRYRRGLAALMIDVDHFKKINDTYGHAVGDDVLREVARRLHGNLRESDVLGRYGGEEFAVILPTAGLDEVHIVAERILTTLSIVPVPTSKGPISVTASLGMALLSHHDQRLDQLLSRADAALYQAKANGRNRAQMG